ncbi:type I-C CRISPR-associated endonuclease Cas1 [bacterium]|nr:type I-C CRISPR-associated endonuclease Cas1 [bacterium]
MRRLLNTLFITTQGAYLSKKGETVLVNVDGQERKRFPIHNLGSLVCFGRVSCSPYLLGLCGERGVAVSFLTTYGRFLARVQGPISGNVLLRREQYRRADNLKFSAEVARALVIGKIVNCRRVLNRFLNDHPKNRGVEDIRRASVRLKAYLTDLSLLAPLDAVRGVEGEAARCYYSTFDHLITKQKSDFAFYGRSRRPPQDNINALLSFLYTLLMHDVRSALETVGLDPAVGYLHRDRPGRYGLALDLMEGLRPFLADRLALSLINLQQVHGKGFRQRETGGVVMNDRTRKTVLVVYQERKNDELTHPFIGERVKVGLIPFIQALLFARYLRGDLNAYPPFVWR